MHDTATYWLPGEMGRSKSNSSSSKSRRSGKRMKNINEQNTRSIQYPYTIIHEHHVYFFSRDWNQSNGLERVVKCSEHSLYGAEISMYSTGGKRSRGSLNS